MASYIVYKNANLIIVFALGVDTLHSCLLKPEIILHFIIM